MGLSVKYRDRKHRNTIPLCRGLRQAQSGSFGKNESNASTQKAVFLFKFNHKFSEALGGGNAYFLTYAVATHFHPFE